LELVGHLMTVPSRIGVDWNIFVSSGGNNIRSIETLRKAFFCTLRRVKGSTLRSQAEAA